MAVMRIFVEKKSEFAAVADSLYSDILYAYPKCKVSKLRLFNRYDVENLSEEDFAYAVKTVFSEPQVDYTYDELPVKDGFVLAVEYLPGQFDQRADSAAQCIQLFTQKERPTIANARVYVFEGDISEEYKEKIKRHIINPVESREASMEKPETLAVKYPVPEDVKVLEGFIDLDRAGLTEFLADMGLAMDIEDIGFCQDYFKNTENRNPTITEVKMIDTYWSDHCRHTTFATNIDEVVINTPYIKAEYENYLSLRESVHAGKERPITLMDLATIGAKHLRKTGKLEALDVSEEINACSVKINVKHDEKDEEWLLMFKNETHNHPTEIEPFGGAATCLGGAIRDPLSGRSYVYQAMRVSGAADPFTPQEETLKGKLPQKKITTTAAAGYSSYGNQIGLCTGNVSEVYHSGYVAKRLEAGAVIAAAPAENVIRLSPEAGDVIILLGGKTGRDGCGGATGSSKSHTADSLEDCGAEVQKGNAPEERKIQRLFRNKEATTLIKRCNDFGAGGVSVAIGELADGLKINLDKVTKKYDGLDGTELAISESQERMAVVVRPHDVEKFISLAKSENLEANIVAEVTEEKRLVMHWRGEKIVDLSRAFLDLNGAVKHTKVEVAHPEIPTVAENGDIKANWLKMAEDLNIACQKGMGERFDATVGKGSVTMPFGGKHRLTPTQAMAAKIPVLTGDTTTCSLMSWGFNPIVSTSSPYHGAVYAVIDSAAKLIATGGSRANTWLSFQEFFEKLRSEPKRWGKPFAALLGGLKAQRELEIGAIGGKDSMSGSFEDIDVPPTLISFAVSVGDTKKIISPELKNIGSNVYYIAPFYDENRLPDFATVRRVFNSVEKLIDGEKLLSAWAVGMGGIAEGVTKMAVGNGIGFKFAQGNEKLKLFEAAYGGFILEAKEELSVADGFIKLGTTTADYNVIIGDITLDMSEIEDKWVNKFEPIFPMKTKQDKKAIQSFSYEAKERVSPKIAVAKPKVLIPVFPGTNSEYDTARAFEMAGAQAEMFVINTLTPADITASVEAFYKQIEKSNIIAIPGGFSGGDEPDGSAKFITSFFRNPQIKEAVHKLLSQRDGLMIGICNGFQALIKLGLVPYGEIIDTDENCPTITYNVIGRHQSGLVNTKIASNKSPWLMHTNVGDIHSVAISHGEGRFVASEELVAKLAENGQIATQYVDLSGAPSMDIRFNPNGALHAIEGITSPDGRVLGKMGHSERSGKDVFKNIPGEKDQMIFKGAVDYFKI